MNRQPEKQSVQNRITKEWVVVLQVPERDISGQKFVTVQYANGRIVLMNKDALDWSSKK